MIKVLIFVYPFRLPFKQIGQLGYCVPNQHIRLGTMRLAQRKATIIQPINQFLPDVPIFLDFLVS